MTPHRHRLVFGLAVLFLGLSAVLFWGVKRSQRALYRRYTSPPLGDGTRYTFLYPAYLREVRPGWLNGHSVVSSVRIDQGLWTPSRWDRVCWFLHLPGGQPMESSVTVLVGEIKGAWHSGAHQDAQWSTGDTSQHNISIADLSAHRRFLLLHDDRYHPDLFRRDDPVVARSFRILPP